MVRSKRNIILILTTVLILPIVLFQGIAVRTGSPVRVENLQTRVKDYVPETCQVNCTLSTQSDFFRSSATFSLLDTFLASVPPIFTIAGGILLITLTHRKIKYYFQVLTHRQDNKFLCVWRM